MLLWFEDGSIVGDAREVKAALKADLHADLPRVTFFAHRPSSDSVAKFGEMMAGERGRMLFESDIFQARLLGQRRPTDRSWNGTPSSGLFSSRHPLFVEADDGKYCCVMAVTVPPVHSTEL